MSANTIKIGVIVFFGGLALAIGALDIRRHHLSDEIKAADLRTAGTMGANLRGRPTAISDPTMLALALAREEVAELEARALARRAAMQAEAARRRTNDAAALAADNHDPERGPTKLEHFRNVGRATPAAALQTLVWVAMSGEERALIGGLVLDDRARERAEVILSQIPPTVEPKLTPAALAASWFQKRVMELPSAHIASTKVKDATHATLTVRGGLGSEREISMTLGPSGWQLVVPEHEIEVIQQELLGASSPGP